MIKQNHKLPIAIAIISVNIAIAIIAMHYLEGWDWIDSAYFAVVTLSTIGYGDYTPTSKEAKLFIIFYIVWGVSTTLYALSLIARAWLERYASPYEKLAKLALIKPYQTIKKVGEIPFEKLGRVSGKKKYQFKAGMRKKRKAK